ncbi:MAG: hypothetical protein MRJ93_11360 [Nitrososphaeraceae archaeon]|nr:hypothetical protein [Nitrososphaeraceae archaeon]
MNQIKFERNRTASFIVMYSLYLYFLGLSLRSTSKALVVFRDDKGVMFLFGIGYKGLVPVRSTKKKSNCFYYR